ncbi:hypothetical protein BU24DRAFT_445455 [Aaosphaeria arxii CBS 175.79]|uniref:Zn(2)-C6 fungal-type domain-containing protein n=1 Tax=Aaosphaeria arxii CBS 175.79 TaxID=1450172 RepID=A0A6A5X710_9PLEO|nr:uncharacterized protein BU24DRAFT_445455 [Aaosphaeria arxii CBS 175.79]KAF2008692.1 hypothetical protein BU24DRAFT_445455 [Aaosphaeria arxii CBS 175.79]
MQTENGATSSSGGFRSKRARYSQRACKECQRRKVKCNGNQPCARCAGQSFKCVYSVPSQTRNSPQKTSERRTSSLNQAAARDTESNHVSLPEPSRERRTYSYNRIEATVPDAPPEFSSTCPQFCGPSSTEYTFNAVNGNLQAMGMQSAIPDNAFPHSRVASTSSGRLAQYGPFMKLLTMDPLWDLTRETAVLLLDDWCDGLGTLYPIVSRRAMLETINRIFNAFELALSEGLRESGGAVAEALFHHDTNKLKIILAIGMTKATGGREHQAQRLFQSTSDAVEGLIWNPEGIHGIQLLYLVAMYHYHLNEEVRTGRCIAFAARLCLEAGLHRRAMLEKSFPDTEERSEALQSFWAVYMFERRLSLGQGIPFSIQDTYIDHSLYIVENTNPLLVPLLRWTELAGKTWHALNNRSEDTDGSRMETLSYLDYQITEWYQNLPGHLRLPGIAAQNPDQNPTYYQSVMYVRKAHLRNLIYRPILQSPSLSRQNEALLRRAVDISKDTIITLVNFNDRTDLVQTHPMFFQQLLLTAFGNLLLAIVSAVPKVWNTAREELDMFLNLFQFLSSKCTALKRTWTRLQGLRDLHLKLSRPDRASRPASPLHSGDAATLSFDDIFPDMLAASNTMDSSGPLATNTHYNSILSNIMSRISSSPANRCG